MLRYIQQICGTSLSCLNNDCRAGICSYSTASYVLIIPTPLSSSQPFLLSFSDSPLQTSTPSSAAHFPFALSILPPFVFAHPLLSSPPIFLLTTERGCVLSGGGCQTICSCFLGVCHQEESAQGDKGKALESTFLHCLLLQCPAIPICYTQARIRTHKCT